MKKTLSILVALLLMGSAGAGITGTYVDADPSNSGFMASAAGSEEWTFRTDHGEDGPDLYEGFNTTQNDGYVVTTLTGLSTGLDYEVSVIWYSHTSATWAGYGGVGPFQNEIDGGTGFGGMVWMGAGSSNTTATGTTIAGGAAVQQQSVVGNAAANANGEIKVYVHSSGSVQRTWYDGVAYKIAPLQVSEPNGITVEEGGITADFDVMLGFDPNDSVVTVSISDTSDPDKVTLSSDMLTFTGADWDIPQTVTVTAIDNDVLEGLQYTTIEVAAASGDPNYDGYTRQVDVTIIDNDTVALIGTYLDANVSNTVADDGTDPWLVPDSNSVDNLWTERSLAYANEETALEQANGTESLLIKTTIDGLDPGEDYEVRAVFWARNDFVVGEWTGSLDSRDAVWNILAGLNDTDLDLFIAGYDYLNPLQEFIAVTSTMPIIRTQAVTATNIIAETQVLLGTATADGSGQISAWINGQAIPGGDDRTWYEGLAYQKVMMDVVETDGSTGVKDQEWDSFTVALSSAPSDTVTVSVEEYQIADEVDLSTDTLTFTTGNWSTPQTVYVLGDNGLDTIADTTILLTASSSDTAVDDYRTTVNVKDLDCGRWGYPLLDTNFDCVTDLLDFAALASDWLNCSDPADASCANMLF